MTSSPTPFTDAAFFAREGHFYGEMLSDLGKVFHDQDAKAMMFSTDTREVARGGLLTVDDFMGMRDMLEQDRLSYRPQHLMISPEMERRFKLMLATAKPSIRRSRRIRGRLKEKRLAQRRNG